MLISVPPKRPRFELLKQFEAVIAHADSADEGDIVDVAMLTTQTRDVWAAQREELIAMDDTNKSSVEAIESAMFCVVLEDADIDGLDEMVMSLSPSCACSRARVCVCGVCSYQS